MQARKQRIGYNLKNPTVAPNFLGTQKIPITGNNVKKPTVAPIFLGTQKISNTDNNVK